MNTPRKRSPAKSGKSRGTEIRPSTIPVPKVSRESIQSGESRTPLRDSFPIVGIGASAGGLEAFTLLLHELPADTGMGFVLVQHLDPVHESALSKLLAKATAMPVREVTDNLTVQPNQVYVIPPNTILSIEQGILKLQARKRTGAAVRSIDIFLEALAQDQHERAVGVILSGTASDGTMGLEAIKAEGGITFAQDDSAKYDSMPRSAVAAGCVDLVLSPAEIAKELARIARHPYVAGQPLELRGPEEDRAEATAHEDDDSALPSGGHGAPPTGAKRARAESKHEQKGAKTAGAENGYKQILRLLRNHSGVDFSLYKSNTIQRRINRRVVLNKQNSLGDYADFLRDNAKELDALYSDTLISVTSFFRNPEAYEVLKRKVFPKLLEQRGDNPVRVWVLGCSTGQEAYSLAMAFGECADKAPRLPKLQVFATDLNEALLEKARHGLYAKSLAEDVAPERLRRFFVEEDGGFRVVKSLREMVVFARQNLISDAPFSRLDLISCRNLLIYLEPDLQKKILPIFHYALKPHGVLFLGASESVGGFTELFEPIDKKQKLYSKKAAPTPQFQLPSRAERFDLNPGANRQVLFPGGRVGEQLPQGELNAQREADRLTVNRFAPPGVLINSELQILQFRGTTSPYLQPPFGKATFDVLKMAREGLMLPLRATINKAKKENKSARREKVRVSETGSTRMVNIEVLPLKNLRERCYLILFEDAESNKFAARKPPTPLEAKTPARRSKQEEARRSNQLERELSETTDYLQALQGQYEAANEELQASNEEVQSANEELQSINEELETSKEELESANEELTTVNEEMANRNAELYRLNSDLLNFQASTKIAIVLLGRDLTVRRFSAEAEKRFSLLATDIGRPIRNIRHDLDVSDLEDLVSEVIQDVREQEREVRDRSGRWYSLRVRPYLTLDNKIDGAVLVLLDIDELKQALDYAEAIITTARQPMIVLDEKLRVRTANQSFYETFQVVPEQTEHRFIYDLGNRQWDIPKLRTALEEILPQNNEFKNFEVEHQFESIGSKTMLLSARRLVQQSSGEKLILLAIEDITQRKLGSEALRRSEEKYRTLFDSIDEGFCTIEVLFNEHQAPIDYRFLETNPAFERQTGIPNATGRWMREIAPLHEEFWFETYGKIALTGESMRFEYPAANLDRFFDGFAFRIGDPSERRVAILFNDITARKREEANFNFVAEVSEDLVRLAGIDEITQTIGRKLGAFLGISLCFFVGVNEAADQAVINHAWRRADVPDVTGVYRIRDFVTGAFQRASRAGEIFIVRDTASDRRAHTRSYETFNIGALISVPLIRDGDWRSVLCICDSKPRDWRADELELMRELSSRIWTRLERTRADEALRASEEQFASLFNQSTGGIAQTDLTGQFTLVNDRFCQIVARSRAELLGLRMQDITHPDDLPGNLERFQALAAGHGSNFVIEKRYVRPDGSTVWVHNDVAAIRDAAGNVRNITAAVTDIDYVKQGEIELQAAVVREQEARSTAETANRLKDEFLAIVSHEVRTPLNAISGWAHMLRGGKLNPEQTKRALETIERNTALQVRIINELLDTSRIISGKLKLDAKPVELVSVIEAAVEVVHAASEAKSIQVETQLDFLDGLVLGDSERLQQVIWNLLSNAIKFTPKGGQIQIRLERHETNVAIAVEDTGEGIDPEFLPHAFDRFRQADASSTRAQGGLGLGLSIVRNLVEMHGGTVRAESPGKGQGSTFTVILPVRALADFRDLDLGSLEHSAFSEHSAGIATTKRLEGMRVLIVDDEADTRDLLSLALTSAGAEVKACASASEAMAVIRQLQPDCIVSDIGMPDEDGYMLIKRVRDQQGNEQRDIPAVALTGYAGAEARSRANDAGFQAYLAKPVALGELISIIAQLVEARKK